MDCEFRKYVLKTMKNENPEKIMSFKDLGQFGGFQRIPEVKICLYEQPHLFCVAVVPPKKRSGVNHFWCLPSAALDNGHWVIINQS